MGAVGPASGCVVKAGQETGWARVEVGLLEGLLESGWRRPRGGESTTGRHV